MRINLQGKVIVVTGGSRGIGRALIREFSNENAKVVICYYNSENEANELYEELIIKNLDCIKVKADVTNIDDVKRLRDQTIAYFGKIDVLINNAGVCDDNNIQAMSLNQWERVIDVNLTGVYLCCKVFSQIMINQKSGKIINISSLKGQEGSAGQTNYSTSKAGLIGFSKSLAKELGKFKIIVNVVCPGFILTDLNDSSSEKKRIAEKRSSLPMDKNLQDLLHFLVYMSSDKMLNISGQVFNIDSRL